MSLSKQAVLTGYRTLCRCLSSTVRQSCHYQTSAPTEKVPVTEQLAINKETLPFTELVRDFLDPTEFFQAVRDVAEINFICGVPDSLLKDFCAYVSENVPPEDHVIAANEGNAIAIAAGYHLATGKSPMVYMQNSGIGNAVNPLVSLAAPEIYRFPMLLLIGWRGEPGKRDEPQHQLQGRLTPSILAALGIPFQTLPDYIEGAQQALATAKYHLGNSRSAYALLVKRQTFLPYKAKRNNAVGSHGSGAVLTREIAVQLIADGVHKKGEKIALVGSTGMASRELFEHRSARGQSHSTDFLCVGAMGHASSIALGIAIHSPRTKVYCIDGDGSVIMHMGALPVAGGLTSLVPNFRHIVLNNGAHDSVGGQPTAASNFHSINLTQAALACGYKEVRLAVTKEEAVEGVEWLQGTTGPAMLEIRVKKGGRKNLGRPTNTPVHTKEEFMKHLQMQTTE
ncbi:phosphonopyruvate decarboxylase-like [Ischnura elegans]|uniref:phosphonopyruvate decarboxylase-like n=1 Tax=Ischnura elegans TaxID=197161 RepID=UPI001ED88001|nr:phosphonopyruvate decarboxylase-like [Ischnura elegans]XP_046397277.1 phosphonopyruvate decarboxylase-like [Ischnura elegans]XP_046397278.1 phosphonopyruvate decarboxylase-like [Ischnura elegans]